MKRRTPLKRKTPMRRKPMRGPRVALRRTWIKRMSEKAQTNRQIYLMQKKRFLDEHPMCEVNQTHPPSTYVKGIFRQHKSKDVHHVKGRGRYYLDESTWLAACRPCHDWIHAHANRARALGLLQF